jgi:hypothetical protein
MNKVIGAVTHPSDGDLVRYLDTELAELDERRMRAHLDGCARCAVRFASLAGESAAVGRYIGDKPVDAPDMVTRARVLANIRIASAARHQRRRPQGGRLLLAACAVLVLLLAAPPVRAWMSGALGGLRGAPAATATATLPAAVVHRSSVVAFAPRGVLFEVQIERFQAEGSLTVQVRDVPRASAQVLDGSSETMLILPSGLRIENASSSHASYLVVVPAGLPLVRVSVGGHTVASYSVEAGAVPASRTFALRGVAAGR